MKVLSCFDGISCAQVALDKLGYKPDYYASEIDVIATDITRNNYPDTTMLGDITKIGWHNESIDLLVGGFPCQDLSIAGKRVGLGGARSSLFWEFVRLLKSNSVKYFVLENVRSMKDDDRQVISSELGVEPIMIDASLVSAQSRKRYFWTNIPGVVQPEDQKIYLKSVLESGSSILDKSYAITSTYYKGMNLANMLQRRRGTNVIDKPIRIGEINVQKPHRVYSTRPASQANRVYSADGKSVTLRGEAGGLGAKTGLYLVKDNSAGASRIDEYLFDGESYWLIRKLTPLECERLMGLFEHYTEYGMKADGSTYKVSNTQRYRCVGNAFHADVIAHILGFADL